MRKMKCGGTQPSVPLSFPVQANHAFQRDGKMAGRIIKFYGLLMWTLECFGKVAAAWGTWTLSYYVVALRCAIYTGQIAWAEMNIITR